MSLANFFEVTTVGITLVTAITTFVVVCGPMNKCHILVRWFVLLLGIGAMGATIDRVGRLFAMFDEGSVASVSTEIVWLVRVITCLVGVALLAYWHFHRSEVEDHGESDTPVVVPARRIDNRAHVHV